LLKTTKKTPNLIKNTDRQIKEKLPIAKFKISSLRVNTREKSMNGTYFDVFLSVLYEYCHLHPAENKKMKA